jgi:L-threonylcarbamoyladenylate synthase
VRTLRLTVDAHDLESEASQGSLRKAASILQAGGLVAFPTETVYGLGANALDAAAVERIFAAKQRPAWDPVIVHIADMEMLAQVAASIPDSAERLRRVFWPGPLTLLLPRHENVPIAVTAGRQIVGIRMPAHPVALELIRKAGIPIAAPSANTFGRISPTLAEHVLEDLDGRIDAILDSGETTHGLESTVVDPSQNPVMVYRPGVITLEQIRAVCGEAQAYAEAQSTAAPPESQPSPGVSIRHYAPHARLVLVEGRGAEQAKAFDDATQQARREHERLGLMLPDDFGSAVNDGALIYRWGSWSDEEELAQRLFAGLRELDRLGATVIVCPLPADEGIGTAICDRLRRAARKG